VPPAGSDAQTITEARKAVLRAGVKLLRLRKYQGGVEVAGGYVPFD